MRQVVVAAAAALALSTAGATAQDELGRSDPTEPQTQAQQGCLKWPVAMVAAQANNPGAQLVRNFEGHLAHDFVNIVNQLPPASSFDGDHVALFFRKSDEQFLVVIGQDQCARHVVELPAAIFARMLGQEA
jgi:hypothetical protein